jgi:hypothetical protein
LEHHCPALELRPKFSFHRLIKSTKKSIVNIQKDIKKGGDIAINKALLTDLQTKIVTLTMSRDSYRHHLRALSIKLHPFSILSSNPQSSSVVETKMLASLSKIKSIKTNHKISDLKKKLNRVENQIPDAAKQIDLWWNWVKTSLESVDMTPELKDWLLLYLLPYIYWSSQLKKTRSKIIKRFYSWSIRKAKLRLMAHPLTERMLPSDRKKESEWIIWAKNMTNTFQRTTSPVEGRNGWLSQMHFNGRGLSKKRIKSQTTIHNYFLKREDGTTACERLTGEKPDDLFEFIMENIGSLSEPRKRKSTNHDKPLILKSVPA